MEQAVNLFTKGLQIDSHPMVQGNDTLSDALNATFITLNGNEVILQNDMGNRRIDNAFLPAGYEPIGIKEYGGIIYVVSYNPITNRSLVGSFPSPERKISDLDDEDLGGEITINEFKNFRKVPDLCDLKCLITDTILERLSGKLSLHAGDKFLIYANDSNNRNFGYLLNAGEFNASNLSNCFNTRDLKIISPKNKLFTFKVGILNSLNKFVDITNSLCRINENGQIIDESDKTDLYKFNDGYFISGAYIDNGYNETENDANFILLRNLIAANTYAYKLVGPLYLLAELNHILNFSYSYGGNYDKKRNKLFLEITVNLEYNCPDNVVNSKESPGDENYHSLEDGEVLLSQDGSQLSIDYYDFYEVTDKGFKNPEKSYLLLKDGDPIPKVEYSKTTNMYYLSYRKMFEFGIEKNLMLFKYVLGVRSGLKIKENNDEEDLYLQGLSDVGVIDLSLFGSGQVKATEWRFYNENNETTLTYSIKTYPREGEIFSDFVAELTGQGVLNSKLKLRGGTNTIKFRWQGDEFLSAPLEKRNVYKVTITCKSNLQEGRIKIAEDLFLLTTELFNPCYHKSSNDYVRDFAHPDDVHISNIWNSEHNGKAKVEIMRKYLTITPDFDSFISTTSGDVNNKINGSFFIINNNPNYSGSGKVESVTTLDFEVIIDKNVKINEELYPNYVSIGNLNNCEINVSNIKGILTDKNNNIINIEDNESFSGSIKETPNSLSEGSLDRPIEDLDELILEEVENNSNNITVEKSSTLNIKGSFTWRDICTGKYKKYTDNIYNVYDTAKHYLDECFIDPSKDNSILSYSGTCIDSKARTGPKDSHYIRLIVNNENPQASKWVRDLENVGKNAVKSKDVGDIDNIDDSFFDYFECSKSDQDFMEFDDVKIGGEHKTFMFLTHSLKPDYDTFFFDGEIEASQEIKEKINTYKIKYGKAAALRYLVSKKPSVRIKFNNQNKDLSRNTCCRLYWRNSLGSWSIVDKVINVQLNSLDSIIKNFIESEIFENNTKNIYFVRYNLLSYDERITKGLNIYSLNSSNITNEYSGYRYNILFDLSYDINESLVQLGNSNMNILNFHLDTNRVTVNKVYNVISNISSNETLFEKYHTLENGLLISNISISGEEMNGIVENSGNLVYYKKDGKFIIDDRFRSLNGNIVCNYVADKLEDHPIDVNITGTGETLIKGMNDNSILDSWTWFYYDSPIPIYKITSINTTLSGTNGNSGSSGGINLDNKGANTNGTNDNNSDINNLDNEDNLITHEDIQTKIV